LKEKECLKKVKICFILALKNNIAFPDKMFANQFLIKNGCLKVYKPHIIFWMMINVIVLVCKAEFWCDNIGWVQFSNIDIFLYLLS